MKKLLQINISANCGSTGRIAEQIGVKAKTLGYESYIVYGNSYTPSKSHLIKVGPKWNKYLHYIEQFFRDNEGLCSRYLTKKLIIKIGEIKPDIVHLHNIHDHFINYKYLFEYLNSTDIKVVWTFHDCWAFTGHCYHFVFANCLKWQKKCEHCPTRNRFKDRSASNYSLKKQLFTGNNHLTIVAVSEWMGGLVKESFLKDKRIQVIHNGVDLQLFKPTKPLTIGSRKFNILAVSNVWLPYKGINDIFKLRDLLNEDYEITIVGLRDNQIRTLPRGITGICRTQNVQELVALYNSADVFINPTYADSFPTVNLEALACGTPVITYRTGGSPESVTPDVGIVVEQGDVEGLCNAIFDVKKKGKESYSASCRERAVQYFDKDNCYLRYCELYDSLLV